MRLGMSTLAALAGGVAALVTALATPTAAAAAPAGGDLVYLYTAETQAECQRVGVRGAEEGIWTRYDCRLGFAGYSVLVRPTPYLTGAAEPVHLTTFADLQGCEHAAHNGLRAGVWYGYECRSGFAGYSLGVWA